MVSNYRPQLTQHSGHLLPCYAKKIARAWAEKGIEKINNIENRVLAHNPLSLSWSVKNGKE